MPRDQFNAVLAVDDEALVLDLVEAALVDGGFAVTTALSGSDAVTLLESDRARDFHGLVTDVNLGRTPNGWGVARRARELNPAIFVVYISGDSGHELERMGVPGARLLEKPFLPGQLISTLNDLIRLADLESN